MRDFLMDKLKRILRMSLLLVFSLILGNEVMAQCPVQLTVKEISTDNASCLTSNDGQAIIVFESLSFDSYHFKLIDASSNQVITLPDNPFSKVNIVKDLKNNLIRFDGLPSGEYCLMVSHAKPNCFAVLKEKQGDSLFVINAVSSTCPDEK